jgi:hypothetical protein
MRTDAQVFDLLALGLTWVQEGAHDGMSGWTGNGVLQTVRLAGGLDDRQHRAITQHPSDSLRAYFVHRSHLAWPGKSTSGRPALHRAIGQSDKLLIVVVNTGMFFGDKILTPRGYRLLMTERGQDYARSVAARYETEMPHDTFWGQWMAHRQQMKGMHAHARRVSQSEG